MGNVNSTPPQERNEEVSPNGGPIIPYLSTAQRDGIYKSLASVVQTLDEGGVRWWMAYSTLLGAVRHGGVIPWNDTVELQIFDTDVDKFEKINWNHEVTRRSNGYVINDGTNDIGITVMTKQYDYVMVASQVDNSSLQFNQERYEFNFLFPLIRLKFGPLSLYAPQQPHEWLWRVYGTKYMQQDIVKPPKTNPLLFRPYVIKLDRRTGFPLKRKRFITNRPAPVFIEPYTSPQLD